MLLQDKIKESDYTMNEIAYELGVSEMTLYRKLTGKSKLKRGELQIITNMLNIDENEQKAIQEELKNA